MRRNFDNSVWVGVGLIVALLLLIPAIFYRNTRQLNMDARWVAHTDEVLNLTSDVMLALVDAETGQRGFVITGKDEFLQPYDAALLRLDGLMAKLKEKTKESSDQQARIKKLEEMTAVRLGQMKEAIALQREDEKAAKAFVLTGKPNAQMDAIRKHVTEMEQVEDDLLKERESKTAATYQTAVTTGLLSAALGLIATGVFVWLLKNSLRMRQQAEAKSRASDAEFRAAFEQSAVGKAQVDAKSGRFIRVNAKLCEMTGYSAEELAKMPPADLTFAEDRDAHAKPIAQLLRGETALYEAEKRYLRKDGKIIWVHVNATLLRDADGHPDRSMAVIQDITARKHAQETLRASEESFRATFASAPVGIAHIGLDGRWLRLNDAICSITGYQRETLVTLTFADITHPDDVDTDWSQARRLLAGEIALYSMEKRYIRANGELVWVNLTVSLMRDAKGAPVNFISVVEDITERKEADTARARLAAIVQGSDDAIIAKDLSGVILTWNRAAERLFGYTEAEAVGHPITMLVPPELRDEEARILKHVHEGGDFEHFETVRSRKDGTRLDVSLTISPLLDGRGKVVGASKIARDITERKESERALRASNEQFQAMANAMSQLGWIAKPDGFIYWYNRRWYEYTGTTPEQMEGWGWQSVHDPEVLPQVLAQWKASIATGESFDMTFPLRGADGVFRQFLTLGIPLKDEQGRVLQWFGTNTDVDELKRAEAALHESETRMRLATEATAVGIWERNILTNAIRWDAQMFRIYGIPPTADGFVQYSEWSGAVLPEDLPENERILQDTVRRCGHSSREFRILRRDDGECRVVEAVETVLTNEQGQAQWVLGTNLDITERKQTEQQIRRLNVELEQRVVERTAALEMEVAAHRLAEERVSQLNDQLTARVAELGETNAELESFSYTVSHDLRAPLRHVSGFVHLLGVGARGKLDADTAEFLPRISDATTRMGQLIDALLDFSRLGRAGLHPTRMNLEKLVGEIRAHLQPDIEDRAIEWKIASLPVVQADPTMLRQVLSNLMDNAVKFTRTQPAAVIEITCESGPAEHVVRIRDNGAGFDPRYADKLFGVFQRLHTGKEFEGTGIGLATSRRIIQRHGGRIWAESQPGSGADFYFSLPKN
ncbi:MAG: PAS domain S-box protein [Luteolibacter sp.]